MIPVQQQPEPAAFDRKVRQRGLRSLKSQKNKNPNKLKPYWQKCLNELYQAYHGQCAYLAVYFEIAEGAACVDHYRPKSRYPKLAYEWSNYRLATRKVNARKRDFEDVLDPFGIKDGDFHLEFVNGDVFPNPDLSDEMQNRIETTISRLKLNAEENKKMRMKHFLEYINKYVSCRYLKTHSPFVYREALRQGLL